MAELFHQQNLNSCLILYTLAIYSAYISLRGKNLNLVSNFLGVPVYTVYINVRLFKAITQSLFSTLMIICVTNIRDYVLVSGIILI